MGYTWLMLLMEGAKILSYDGVGMFYPPYPATYII